MKRLACILSLLLCCGILSACSGTEPEDAKSYPDIVSVAEYDLSSVRAVCLGSGMTGRSTYLTEKADIDAILAAVLPLTGTDPISSRGYYGWNYDFAFYDTPEPTEHDTPLLTFSVADYGKQTYLVTDPIYEEVDGWSYKAMYTVDKGAAEALFAVCGRYKAELGEADSVQDGGSSSLRIPEITVTPVDSLPHAEGAAHFSDSPVGGNPTIYFFEDSLTFYFREYLSAQLDARYYSGTLTLPDGFTDGKVMCVARGAGSGEIFVSLEAMRDGKKEYLSYAFFGTEPPTAAYVLDEKQTERLFEQIRAEVLAAQQTFSYDGVRYDLSEIYSGINGVEEWGHIGKYVIVSGHVNPNISIFALIDPETKRIEHYFSGSAPTYYGEDIHTIVYAYGNSIRSFDGTLLADLVLNEGEYIRELKYSDDKTQIAVIIDRDSDSRTVMADRF